VTQTERRHQRPRLAALDGLRLVAALAVMGYHYAGVNVPYWGVPSHVELPTLSHVGRYGYLGVNLFFVISGFVIFMTLDRTRKPMDFVVSRASRLYPAYWAAILMTWVVTNSIGLPGKEPTWQIAVLNIPMFQQLFGVPLVDGVYWTLGVELLFYALAFLLFLSGRLDQVLVALAALLLARLGYWAAAEFAHIDLPWRLRYWLVLDYIAYFSLGIAIYRLVHRRGARAANASLVVLAIVVVAVTESVPIAAVAGGCFVMVLAAARGRLTLLDHAFLVYLGTISYSLYLLHENIGWAVLRQFGLRGAAPLLAIACTTVMAIALATIVSRCVEYPAMRWIRRTYRASRDQPSHRASV
jgi:peptidoglycan/LPS O-acetylase OafA/YrhL